MLEPWVIGCLINLCGSVLINIGTNFIKFHHQKQESYLRMIENQAINQSSNQSNDECNKVKYTTEVHPVNLSNRTPAASPHSQSINATINQLNNQIANQTNNPFSQNNQTVSPPVKPPPHSFYWYLGFSLFFVGNVSNFVSMGFTAQSLLAGLGSIQFITNVLCSCFILNQSISRRVLYATFCIVCGNMLIVTYASHQSINLTVNELWANYTQNVAYQVYCAILVCLVCVLYVYYKETKHRLKTSSDDQSINQPAKRFSISNISNLDCLIDPRRFLPFSYATISAIIGTQSVLLAKSSSELIRTTIKGNNQLVYPFTYFIFSAWILSMVFWLYRMNAALRKFEGAYIIPVLQVVWTIFSIVGGGIYFREFDFTRWELSMFTTGVIIVMLGVYLLAPQTTTVSRRTSNADMQLPQHQSINQSNNQSLCQECGADIVPHGCSLCHTESSNQAITQTLNNYQIRQLLNQTIYSNNQSIYQAHHTLTASTESRSRSSSLDSTVTDLPSPFNIQSLNESFEHSSNETTEQPSNLIIDMPESPVTDIELVVHHEHHTDHIRLPLPPLVNRTNNQSPVNQFHFNTTDDDQPHDEEPLIRPVRSTARSNSQYDDARFLPHFHPLAQAHLHSHPRHNQSMDQSILDISVSPSSQSRTISHSTTPRNSSRTTRARGMSLGFSMPMFEDSME